MAYNILIVDDSATMRTVVKRTVDMSGLNIGTFYEAENGKHALELLKENWIDLVLADINMPIMDGIEMTEHMQTDPELCRIPVIVVSTEASSARIEELKGKGVKGYVHKPFTPEKIRDVINHVLCPASEILKK